MDLVNTSVDDARSSLECSLATGSPEGVLLKVAEAFSYMKRRGIKDKSRRKVLATAARKALQAMCL